MGYSKMSVTIPDEIYKEIKEIASRKKVKLSHFVTATLVEKARQMKEESFVERINQAFDDPEVGEDQRQMAEMIADNTEVEELPW